MNLFSTLGQENCARFARAEARECSNLRQARHCRLFPVFFLPLTCVAPAFVEYAQSVDDLICSTEKVELSIGRVGSNLRCCKNGISGFPFFWIKDQEKAPPFLETLFWTTKPEQ